MYKLGAMLLIIIGVAAGTVPSGSLPDGQIKAIFVVINMGGDALKGLTGNRRIKTNERHTCRHQCPFHLNSVERHQCRHQCPIHRNSDKPNLVSDAASLLLPLFLKNQDRIKDALAKNPDLIVNATSVLLPLLAKYKSK